MPNQEILTDYLDNRLDSEEQLKAEQLISEDAAMAAELDNLRFSVDLIRESAVYEQAVAARTAYNSSARLVTMPVQKHSAVVRPFAKQALRIAATVLVLLGAATLYKYSNTDSATVYNENFTSFELSNSRGSNNDGELETAYRNKNWTAVEQIAAVQKEKDPKAAFLFGMAGLELKEYTNAISAFNQVLIIDKNDHSTYFQDEAEYYLALAYLGNKQPADAVKLIRKIKANPEHLFYKKASSLSVLDLKMLEMH